MVVKEQTRQAQNIIPGNKARKETLKWKEGPGPLKMAFLTALTLQDKRSSWRITNRYDTLRPT